MNIGKITQVIGPVVDVEFPTATLPPIYNALTRHQPGDQRPAVEPGRRGRPAPRREHRALHRDGHDRRPGARHGRAGHRRRASRCRSAPQTLGRIINVVGEPVDERRPDRGARRTTRSTARRRRSPTRRPRSRCSRPASRSSTCSRPYSRGGKIGLFGGAGVGKTVSSWSSSTTSPSSTAATRCSPASASAPARATTSGSRCSESGVISNDRAGLRPDERAARRPRPRRPLRAHRRRVLPRRRGQGRAALHRQHLPLHPGGLRGVGAPRPHALRRRLPADAVDRHGRAAGAHHLDQEGLDHLGAGDLRARRRPHRPGAGDDLRPPRRDHRAVAPDRRARHLPGRRSARLDLAHSRPERRRRGALQASPARCRRSCSATRTCRTSSPSSAWTSSRRTTS